MSGHNHYVPILKSKQAELDSIKELSPNIKKNVTPLIELIPVEWDHAKDKPKTTLQAHLDKFIGKLVKLWGYGSVFFLDLALIGPGSKVNGLHPIQYLFETLYQHDIFAIPTISTNQLDDYKGAVANIAKKSNRVCLRIKKDDIEDLLELQADLDNLLASFKLTQESCDIIVDLENLDSSNLHETTDNMIDVLQYFPYINLWRSVTLAASSFPEILNEVQQDDTKLLPRHELTLWRSILSQRRKLLRLPSFGDYAIQHPNLSDLDFRFIKSSVNLRYTTDRAWLVFKGKEKNRYGYNQFNAICRLLLGRKEYCGQNYSWGDGYIHRCAYDEDGPGNAMTWRKVGFSHHITLTAEQVEAA